MVKRKTMESKICNLFSILPHAINHYLISFLTIFDWSIVNMVCVGWRYVYQFGRVLDGRLNFSKVEHFPFLECGEFVVDDSIQLLKNNRLKTITLFCYGNVTINMPKLQCLSLERDSHLKTIILQDTPIKSLTFNRRFIFRTNIPASIEHLSFLNCSYLPINISRFKNLQTLRLHECGGGRLFNKFCRQVTISGFQNSKRFILNLPNVTHLVVEHYLCQKELQVWLQCFPKLEMLTLYDWSNKNEKIQFHHDNLQTIEMIGVTTQIVFDQTYLPKLQNLKFEKKINISCFLLS